jgi:hypothetical protein
MAEDAGLDLVEISPNNDPPVCKILDLGKLKYANQKKAAEARKKQKIVEIKEIKMRPNIDTHDYEVKMKAMNRFFEDGDKVKRDIALPRPRDGSPGTWSEAPAAGQGRHGGNRQGRGRAEARRPPDDDGAGAALSAGPHAGEPQQEGFLIRRNRKPGLSPMPVALFPDCGYKPRVRTVRQGMPRPFLIRWSCASSAGFETKKNGVAKCPR